MESAVPGPAVVVGHSLGGAIALACSSSRITGRILVSPAGRQVAEAQARVLATGLENADIDIVGGESAFFDRIVGAISLGKSVDGFMDGSQTARALAGPWLDGSASFTEDLTKVLGSVSTADVQNLTVSALLMKLMPAGSGRLDELIGKARQLGLADMPVSELAGLNGAVTKS
ncbi:alpha/beta fold hydrolase [Streptomyces lavendulocolor]|uniref:alpha/beta fold hydrolase n=1 Tax=Streptomyces lavendulocolor TaxID=67316 RepID=UPI003C2EF9AB